MLPEEPASATLPNTKMMYPVYPNTKMQIHWIYTIVRSTLTTAQCARTPKKISTLVTYINPQNHQYSHSLGLTELNILHVRKPHGGAASSIAQLQLTIQKKRKRKKKISLQHKLPPEKYLRNLISFFAMKTKTKYSYPFTQKKSALKSPKSTNGQNNIPSL
jgi:hypothetical protein